MFTIQMFASTKLIYNCMPIDQHQRGVRKRMLCIISVLQCYPNSNFAPSLHTSASKTWRRSPASRPRAHAHARRKGRRVELATLTRKKWVSARSATPRAAPTLRTTQDKAPWSGHRIALRHMGDRSVRIATTLLTSDNRNFGRKLLFGSRQLVGQAHPALKCSGNGSHTLAGEVAHHQLDGNLRRLMSETGRRWRTRRRHARGRGRLRC